MNFPIAAWQITRPAFRCRLGSGGWQPIGASSANSIWGFGISSVLGGNADTNTIAGDIAANIGSALSVGAAAFYVYTNGTSPSVSPSKYAFVTTATQTITIDFYSVAAAKTCGFLTQTVTIPPASPQPAVTYSQINAGGIWAPCGVAGDIRRIIRQRAASSSSDMSGVATDVVNWGAVADLELMSAMFPAGNFTRWFAATQIYATAANRNIADPNNTLEGLFEAAAQGATFRLYREAAIAAGTTPTTFNLAKMPAIGQRGAAAEFVAAVDEPRIWSTAGLIFRAST